MNNNNKRPGEDSQQELYASTIATIIILTVERKS